MSDSMPMPIAEAKSNVDIAPCLSVVMPVFNEAANVASVVASVLAQRPVQELIIIDDGSTDGTWHILSSLRDGRVKLFQHAQNQGKGAAIRTGLDKASAPVLVIQDADLEYDPEEYHRLLKPILTNHADVVFGSRFLGGPHRVLYFWHSVGNKWLTTLSNMATNQRSWQPKTLFSFLTVHSSMRHH